MERRKVLLGSGAALATALAGCSSSETSDDDDPDDDSPKSDDGNNDDKGDKDNNDDGETEIDDVPGFDGKKLDIDSDAVSVKKIERKDDKVHVVATTEVTDLEVLYGELETIVDNHEKAAVDYETFVSKIKTIEWTINHNGEQVAAFSVNVQWIVDYYENAISRDEFVDKVKETTE